MKIEFIIYSHFFKERGMKVKGDWNFPHLPRIGEEISPHIIMFQNEFTYQNLLEYLTDEAKSDFNKFNDGEDDLVLESYKEKSGIKTSYYGALGMFFPVNQNLSFITELSYYRNAANRLTSESSIKQINYGLNFSGGIKFNIIK